MSSNAWNCLKVAGGPITGVGSGLKRIGDYLDEEDAPVAGKALAVTIGLPINAAIGAVYGALSWPGAIIDSVKNGDCYEGASDLDVKYMPKID